MMSSHLPRAHKDYSSAGVSRAKADARGIASAADCTPRPRLRLRLRLRCFRWRGFRATSGGSPHSQHESHSTGRNNVCFHHRRQFEYRSPSESWFRLQVGLCSSPPFQSRACSFLNPFMRRPSQETDTSRKPKSTRHCEQPSRRGPPSRPSQASQPALLSFFRATPFRRFSSLALQSSSSQFPPFAPPSTLALALSQPSPASTIQDLRGDAVLSHPGRRRSMLLRRWEGHRLGIRGR